MEPAGPCAVCPADGARPARYTCPRCNAPYCSLRCYRAHGACAEGFYRDQVLRELRGRHASPSRLAGALRRLREQREADGAPDDQPDGQPDDQPEGDAGPAPGGASGLWRRLSAADRAAFERLLSRGEAGRLLPPWRPWWWGGGAGPGQPGEPEGPEEPGEPAAPRPPARIPALRSLCHGPASPLVRFQLPNVLFAYAHALALFHGGDDALLPELGATLLGVSGALGARQAFASADEALLAAARALETGGHPPGPLGARGAMREAARILLGRGPARPKDHTLAALGHLADTLRRARARAASAEERGRLYRARKKCVFLLAWANENGAALAPLALDCARAHRAHAADAEEVAALAAELERLWGGPLPPAPRTLIEELPS